MDECRQITRKGSPPYFARGLARLTRSPWRAVVSARLGGISTGALSNLLPTASIGRLGASQHDPPAPASNAPSFSVVSSVADSVFGGASRRARIAEVLNVSDPESGIRQYLGAVSRLNASTGLPESDVESIYAFRHLGTSEGEIIFGALHLPEVDERRCARHDACLLVAQAVQQTRDRKEQTTIACAAARIQRAVARQHDARADGGLQAPLQVFGGEGAGPRR